MDRNRRLILHKCSVIKVVKQYCSLCNFTVTNPLREVYICTVINMNGVVMIGVTMYTAQCMIRPLTIYVIGSYYK